MHVKNFTDKLRPKKIKHKWTIPLKIPTLSVQTLRVNINQTDVPLELASEHGFHRGAGYFSSNILRNLPQLREGFNTRKIHGNLPKSSEFPESCKLLILYEKNVLECIIRLKNTYTTR